MKSAVENHCFRERRQSEEIQSRFRAAGFDTLKERIEKANVENQIFERRNAGRRKSFVFRAPERNMGSMMAFKMDCSNELDRVDQKLTNEPKFETAAFNKDMMDSVGIHRAASRNDWLVP